MAGTVYLACSVAMWWHVWSTHPSATATCGCGDTSLFTWFVAWPAHGIPAVLNPLFTGALHHPYGTNLVANTGVLLVGTAVAPVTWLFGPVTALNVAATLAPVAAALSTFALLRRWTSWVPAAFAGGLLYGFSPWVVNTLALEHVDTGLLVLPPLLFLCLDELLVRQTGRWWTWGIALGLLACAQFFVSSEILAMCALVGAIGVAMVVAAAALFRRQALRDRWRHATTGTALGAGVAVVLLAYPAWFAVAGPRHLPTRVWPFNPLIGNRWSAVVLGAPASYRGPTAAVESYGYLGSRPVTTVYLGIVLVAVLVVGLVIWRKDLRLWFCAAMLVIVDWLSMGGTGSGLSIGSVVAHPWRIFQNLPVMESFVPERFTALSSLFAALMLGVILDHAANAQLRVISRSHVRAPLVAALVGLIAVGSVAVRYSLPYVVQPVSVPAWFTGAATRLPAGTVVLTYPFGSSAQETMTWVAVGGLHLSLVGGGGITPAPPDHPSAAQLRDARVELQLEALTGASPLTRLLPLPDGSHAQLEDFRAAVHDWGVDEIVVPPDGGLPSAVRPRSVPLALAYFAAALGRPPALIDGSWVWAVHGVESPPVAGLAPGRLAACASTSGTSRAPDASVACVLRTG